LKKIKKDDKDSEDEVKEEHDEEDEDEDEEEVEENSARWAANKAKNKNLKASACKSEEKEDDEDEDKEESYRSGGANSARWAANKAKNAKNAKNKKEVKEGELPPALQKAIDKKKGEDSDDEDEVKENKYVGGYRDSSKDGQQGPSSKPKPKSNNSQEDSIRSEIERLYKQRDIADEAASKARESGNDDKADHMEDKGNDISRKIRELKDKLKEKGTKGIAQKESNTLDANLLERVLKELNIG